MNFENFIIDKNTILQDLFLKLEKSKHKNFVIECVGVPHFFLEQKILKKILDKFKNSQKKIIVISKNKLLRNILQNTDIELLMSRPAKYTPKKEKENTPIKSREIEKTKNNNKKTFREIGFTSKKIFFNFQGFSRSKIFLSITSLICITLGIIFFCDHKATVYIRPHITVFPTILNVLVTFPSSEISEENSTLENINAILAETELTEKTVIPAGRIKYEVTNAKGKITLYNETKDDKFLLPSHLSTNTGVIFRFDKKVVIPPFFEGKPGELVVEVVADPFDKNGKPIGSRGNIDAGTELFFPALKEKSRELFYAKANKGPLTGGSTLARYFLDDADKERSRELLMVTLREKALENLEKEVIKRSERENEKYVLLKDLDLVQTKMLAFSFPENQIGQEMQTFEVSGKVRVSAIVFRQADILKIFESHFGDTKNNHYKITKFDLNNIEYNVIDNTKFEENHVVKLSVKMLGIKSVNLNSLANQDLIWIDSVKTKIINQEKKEVYSTLVNYNEFDDILDIKITPFWKKTLPTNINKITLKDAGF